MKLFRQWHRTRHYVQFGEYNSVFAQFKRRQKHTLRCLLLGLDYYSIKMHHRQIWLLATVLHHRVSIYDSVFVQLESRHQHALRCLLLELDCSIEQHHCVATHKLLATVFHQRESQSYEVHFCNKYYTFFIYDYSNLVIFTSNTSGVRWFYHECQMRNK